jgi:hypothetical protein
MTPSWELISSIYEHIPARVRTVDSESVVLPRM